MTRIEKLDVNGFKGLTDTSLEFGSLNVITGRNNTGKTSLLEAIELGLVPEQLERYGDQVGNLVHVHNDECNIELYLSNNDCLLSFEFAPPEEALEHTIDTIVNVFLSVPFRGVPKDVELSSTVEWVLRTELGKVEVDDFPNIKHDVLSISYNGESFVLVNIGEQSIQLLLNNEKRIKSSLMSEIHFDDWGSRSPYTDIEELLFDFWYRIPHRFHNYLPERPEGPNDVLFIQQPKIDSPPNSGDEDGVAIKKVEIRDYLNEHDILPEPGVTVEDFDFDVIVFEENGERYEVPYDFMGEGFKTIVGILWQFVGEEDINDVVLMEEPENNMHPGYIGELVPFLVDVAREEDVQLFITTHNVDFISEFFGAFPDDDQEFLESEFRLIQMTETVPKTFDYESAKEQVEGLHLDLRGI